MTTAVELAQVRALTSTGMARTVREANHVSMAELARDIDVSRSTILRWERGDRQPRGEAAIRYGRALRALMEKRT